MKIRVRCAARSAPLDLELPDDVTVGLLPLLLEHEVGVEAARMLLCIGFPPKPIAAAGETPVATLLRPGELVTVREIDAEVKRGSTDGAYVAPCDLRAAVMVKREVPGDNSCLFHAVSLIVNHTEGPGAMRARVAEAVVMHPTKFTAAYLGVPPRDYAAWIVESNAWGGAIELQLLSFLYQTEFVVIDSTAGRTETFGQGEGYTVRGFLWYTGKHYDAMAVASASGTAQRKDQFLFSTRDDRVLAMAADLAKRAA